MSLADQASLLFIPSGYKSQKVYSIFPTDGDGDFDFSRSGSATRIAKNGLITTVDSNIPRLEYPMIDGVQKGCPSLILEPQRTNLIQYSESFSQSYWTKSGSSIASNNAISPDGSLNASKLVEGTNNGFHWMYSGVITVTNATIYNLSVFAKKGERNYIRISQKNGIAVIVNLEDKVFDTIGGSVLSSNITELINDWVRIEYSFQTTSTTDEVYIYAADNGDTQYQGDGTSGVYIYGAMLEQGSYPTSYIPTNGESGGVTRAAESATGSGDAATFSDSEGVLMAEISALVDDQTRRQISVSDGTVQNVVRLHYHDTDSNIIRFQIRSNDIIEVSTSFTVNDIKEFHKVLISYKLNDVKFFIDGFKVGTDTSAAMPIGLDVLNFNQGNGFQKFYGNTKQVQYYNSALTESELEKLTSWTSFIDMAQAQQYSIK